jgi:hypothetical protein
VYYQVIVFIVPFPYRWGTSYLSTNLMLAVCDASAKPFAIGPPAQAASSHMQEGGYGADDKRAWSFSTMLCISG